MRCPECQTELPDGAKFCLECGRKLELNCPECGKLVPLASKFCLECGHDLHTPPVATTPKDLSFEEKLLKIQKYLPSGLSEKILAQRDKIEGEKRQVTIMFVDMKDFTPLTDTLGPEETFCLMDQVYEILIHRVAELEGTVNELRGDGILALFGAPIALEDAPQRAIRSALAIHRDLNRFSEKIRREQRIPQVLVRIGINTGPVVVGALGNDLRVQFTAVGDTINMAARMEQLAEPGSTYVTEDTFKLTEGFYRFETIGDKQVKGKEKPLKVYKVIAPSTRRTRFDVYTESGLTPFVGRERELELLLDGYERTKSGKGQAFSIVGEAGVGKSRLLYEFRRALDKEDVTFLEGKCLSYGRDTAYGPIIDMLKSNFRIGETDGDKIIKQKVRRGLKVLGADDSSTLPYLLELLSIRESGVDKTPMSPEAKKDRIIEALKRIIINGSEIRPLILAFEDLHWMDKGSEDVCKHLRESIAGTRVLMIMTYRPESVSPWGIKSFHNHVNLNRLSDRDSLTMARYLLGTEDIDGELANLLLEKAEGVPLFTEEFVRSFQELKTREGKGHKYNFAEDRHLVTIPSTIWDVIMSRVDRLPEGARKVLRTGAVIDKEFSYHMIKMVTGLQEESLQTHLAELRNAELIYERGVYPQSTYIFKHALTRDVVYDSILFQKKKRLHEQTGYTIETLYKDNITEHWGILAEHFIRAGNYKKGAEYSQLASKKARNMASYEDAIAFGRKWVAALEQLPRTNDIARRIIDARTTLGLYMLQITRISEAKDAVEPIVDSAVALGYKRRLSQIYTILGTHSSWVEENFPEAFKHLEKALETSQEVGDTVSLVNATYWLGVTSSLDCDFEKARYYMETALRISDMANNPWSVSVISSTMSGWAHFFHGRVDSAYQASAEAIRLAEQTGDINAKSWGYVSRGISCYGKGLLEEAKDHLLKGADLSERANLLICSTIAHNFLGEVHSDTGDHETATNHYEEAVSLTKRTEVLRSWTALNMMASAMGRVMTTGPGISVESLYAYVSQNKVKLYEGWIRRYLGKILLNLERPRISEAQGWIEEAVEADSRNRMTFHLGKDYALSAEMFKRKGDVAKAKENLHKAIQAYEECGANGWSERCAEDIANLR